MILLGTKVSGLMRLRCILLQISYCNMPKCHSIWHLRELTLPYNEIFTWIWIISSWTCSSLSFSGFCKTWNQKPINHHEWKQVMHCVKHIYTVDILSLYPNSKQIYSKQMHVYLFEWSYEIYFENHDGKFMVNTQCLVIIHL